MTDKPESETTAVLPVVAWRADDHSSPHVALTPEGLGLVGKRYSYALTPHAPAQAIIDAQAAEIERLKALEPTSRAGAVLGQMKSELDAARAELSTLKAKQVADIDEVMRLTEELAELKAQHQRDMEAVEWCTAGAQQIIDERDAAREALRAAMAAYTPQGQEKTR